jgi:2-oxo-4-hydroxy-4-carboxy--5-ureidoimidazoline (OHCU) decarboxylase
MALASGQATASLVANYANFCRQAALNARDTASLLKQTVANIKSCDRRRTYAAVFEGDPYMNWEYVDGMTASSLGDVHAALALTAMLEFPDIEAHLKLAGSGPGLECLLQFRRDVVSTGLALPLERVLHALLLANLLGFSAVNTLEQYTSRVLQRATREQVLALAERMADYRFSAEQYTRSFTWVLRHCRVAEAFQHEVALHFAQRESVEKAMELKHLALSVGRPRLTDRIARRREVSNVSTGRGGSVVTGAGLDTFQEWLTRVRFPNAISQRLKRRLYFVMSQPAHDYLGTATALAGEAVAPSVARERLAHPEAQVIADVILGLNIQRSPFPELTAFMRSCFRAFPQRDLRGLSLLKYMQLYVASYQHPELWKACWTAVHPLLSYQVIKDVEDFVAVTPVNGAALAEILCTE